MTQEEGFTISNQTYILAFPTLVLTILFAWILKRYITNERATNQDANSNQTKKKNKLNSGSLTDSRSKQPTTAERATSSSQHRQKRRNTNNPQPDNPKSYSHPWLFTTLKAHTNTVLDIDFSTNKKYLASCAEDSANCCKKMSTSPKKKRSRKKKTTKSLNTSQTMLCLPRIVYYSGYYTSAVSAVIPLEESYKFDERLSEATLYHLLRNYLLTPEQLNAYGYPVEVIGQPGKAFIRQPDGFQAPTEQDPSLRKCCRCYMDFQVAPLDNKSSDTEEEEEGVIEVEDGGSVCTYHWGKLLRGDNQDGPPTYSCCAALAGCPGCTVGAVHVSDGKCQGLLDGFVKTRPSKYAPPDGNYGVCALDCEMCYTNKGLEIARVTLIRLDGNVLYDVFVKPSAPIIDYNTRFSGLTAKDLDGVGRTLRDVQADLIYLLNRETILVGHALENDIGLLRLLHPTVVDTAALFPHHFGLPYRRSLKSLVSTYLRKDIQVTGHDSHEDARSCLELVLWKLHKDLRHIF